MAISEARRTVQRINAALQQQKDTAQGRQLQALRAKLVTAPGPYPQPMLLDQLQGIYRMANGADRSALEFYAELKQQLAGIQAELARLVAE